MSAHGHLIDPGAVVQQVVIGMKTLDRELDDALSVMRDVLFGVDPRDRDRLQECVVQALAHLRTHFIEEGESTAAVHVARGLGPIGHRNHQMFGLPQLALAESLGAGFAATADDVVDRIEKIRDFLLARPRLTASVNASAAARTRVRDAVARLGSGHARGRSRSLSGPFPPRRHSRRAMAGRGDAGGLLCDVHPRAACDSPRPRVAHRRLAHRQHGLLAQRNPLQGERVRRVVPLRRDQPGAAARLLPRPARRAHARVFRGTADWIRSIAWTQADIDRAIIGTAKRFLAPVRPRGATASILTQHLAGDRPEDRQARYDALRRATPEEVKRALLDAIDSGIERAAVCVVSSREKLEAANEELALPLAIEDILKSS